MITGRKPKPIPLKVLRMTSQKAAKLVRKQIETPGGLNEPPAFLNAEERKDWQYAIENAPKDVLKRIDAPILAGFIIAARLHRDSVTEMRKHALMMKSPQGMIMQNPYLAIINRQLVLMIRAASELGFTPASRARLESAQPDVRAAAPSDDWEDAV